VLLCTLPQTFAIPAQALEARDLVHDVVILLEILHASSFCSSFAPQSTVVVSSVTNESFSGL